MPCTMGALTEGVIGEPYAVEVAQWSANLTRETTLSWTVPLSAARWTRDDSSPARGEGPQVSGPSHHDAAGA